MYTVYIYKYLLGLIVLSQFIVVFTFSQLQTIVLDFYTRECFISEHFTRSLFSIRYTVYIYIYIYIRNTAYTHDCIISGASGRLYSRIFHRGTVRRKKKPNRTEPNLT